jgi:chemotaxis protein MotB
MRTTHLVCFVFAIGLLATGCTNKKIMAQMDQDIADRDTQIAELEQELYRLKFEAGQERTRADELNNDLKRALGDLETKEKLWLDEKSGMATITMPNTATFASGSTELTAEGKAIIDKVWEVLAKYPDRQILIEGHTDNVPIVGMLRERFTTNWELSSARALAVLHYVRDVHQTDPERLAAVGCGEYRPIAENSSELGKAKNRRVVIVVSSKNGMRT